MCEPSEVKMEARFRLRGQCYLQGTVFEAVIGLL